MQMTMQTLPVLPSVGDQLPSIVKGDGSKTAVDTFALLLGRQMETLSPGGEANPAPWAALNPGSAIASGEAPIFPPAEGVGGGERGDVAEQNAAGPDAPPQLWALLKGGQPAQQGELPEASSGAEVLPAAITVIPVFTAGKGTDFRDQPPSGPTVELPELSELPISSEEPSTPPIPAAAIPTPAAIPVTVIMPVQAAVSTEPGVLPSPAPAPIPAASTALSPPAQIAQETPTERPAELMDRQFSSLLERQQEAPLRSGASRGVPEFRPAPHGTAATGAPASPQASPAAVEAVSTAPAAERLLPSLPGAEDGSPAPVSAQAAIHIHPAAGGPPAPVHEQPQTTAPAVHLSSGQSVPESRIVDQVVGRLAVGAEGEGGSLTLKLNPKELGEVTIDLVVEKDRVKAQIIAQSQQVQEVLEKHLPKLRTALENQGLKLDTLQVSVDGHGQGGESRGFFQGHQRPSAPVRFALRGETVSVPEAQTASYAPREGRGINLRV